MTIRRILLFCCASILLIPALAQNGYYDLRWWSHFDQQIAKENRFRGYVYEGSSIFVRFYYAEDIAPPLEHKESFQVEYYTEDGKLLQFGFLPESVSFEDSSPGAISRFVVSQALGKWGERFDYLFGEHVCVLFDNHLNIKEIRFCGSCPPKGELREMLEYAIKKSEGHWKITTPFEQNYYLVFFTIRHYWEMPMQ